MRLGINSIGESLADMDYHDSVMIDTVIWEQDLYEDERNKKWIKGMKKGTPRVS